MAKPVAERVKANRIRNKASQGIPLSDDEAATLEEYEEAVPPAKNRSASSRVVSLDIEEHAAAEGNHLHPEAYASIARSEGLRADTLLRIVTDRLIACNDQYLRLMLHMMERSTRLEDAHIGLLEAVRDSHLSRIEAEGEALMAKRIDGAADGDGELAEMLKFVLLARQNETAGPVAKKKRRVKAKDKPTLGDVD